MCYLSGPLCADYALAWVELAKKQLSQARSLESRRLAQDALDGYLMQYYGTPYARQHADEIASDIGIDETQTLLETATKHRQEWFTVSGREDMGDVDEAHINKYEDTNPALSLPVPDPIGRVYRRPGDTSVKTGPNGGVILPSDEQIEANIIAGTWLPSITNVIGVRSSPHLMGWAASKAVKNFYEMTQRSPAKVSSNPQGAIGYAQRAAERDRDEAAVRGTKIHYACEQVSLGRSLHPSYLTIDEWRYVESFKAWMNKVKPKFIAREVTVFGTTPHGDYAGTADFIAEIDGKVVAGDYKTTRSGLHIDVAFQLSAVAHATHYTVDGANLLPMMQIDAGVGVLLSATGYEMRQARIRGISWDIFCGLRAVWTTHVLHGRQDDGKDTLSAPLTDGSEIVANY